MKEGGNGGISGPETKRTGLPGRQPTMACPASKPLPIRFQAHDPILRRSCLGPRTDCRLSGSWVEKRTNPSSVSETLAPIPITQRTLLRQRPKGAWSLVRSRIASRRPSCRSSNPSDAAWPSNPTIEAFERPAAGRLQVSNVRDFLRRWPVAHATSTRAQLETYGSAAPDVLG